MRYFLTMKQIPYKHIFIIGPTASGKSDLAIAIAKQYNGEIISADSRQVYRGMDRGTGKVNRDTAQISNIKYQISKKSRESYLSDGIIHHLIDVASPRREYNVSHFLRDARQAIADIEKRGKLPIICGGTHFWIQTLLTGQTLPEVKPDKILRAKLEKKSAKELFSMLKQKDPMRAETIDAKNKYRLVRALEIIQTLGSVPHTPYTIHHTPYAPLVIALIPNKEILRERIRIRLEERFSEGMIDEVRHLRATGISFKRLESFGLEYRFIALFLQGKMTETEMREKLFFESWHFAKRQISFIRRMKNNGIHMHQITDITRAFPLIHSLVHNKE